MLEREILTPSLRYTARLFAGIAHLALAGSSDPAFDQDPLADGVVVMEAENFHGNNPGTQHAWEEIQNLQYIGGKAMIANPELDARLEPGPGVCRLDYKVNFVHTGLHYIIIRGHGPTSDDNSCHAGLNGTATANTIGSFNSGGEWEEGLSAGGRATITVPSLGEHTVNIWMREDGFICDKIVITRNIQFLPTGNGPGESPQGTLPTPTDPRSVTVFNTVPNAGQLFTEFTPAPGVDKYDVAFAPGIGQTMLIETNASVFGYQALVNPSIPFGFMSIRSTPVAPTNELCSILLNRLAYGPTPDEIDRVFAMGPDAYIAEQLAPESITGDPADTDAEILALKSMLDQGTADLSDLRAWYTLRAVRSNAQLIEVLTQFFSNHLVTYFYKTRDYFRDQGMSDNDARQLATFLEYQELLKWRTVLRDPNGTFEDLLRISAESPAMIIYLDTIESDAAEPNENFAREIVELFSMGVDNGYDQDDIEEIARVWTGWRIKEVDPANVGDPFAPPFNTNAVLLAEQSPDWKLLKGTVEPPLNWADRDFDDSTWTNVQTSVGYGDEDDNTELLDMRNGYSTVYIRHSVVVSNASELATIGLKVFVDDGCLVYINGALVAEVNAIAPKDFDDTADATVSDAEWQDVSTIVPLSTVLNVGTNVVALHGLNTSLGGSSDFSLDAQLTTASAWTYSFDSAAHDPSNKVVFAGNFVNSRFGAPWAGVSYELNLPERTANAGIQDGYDLITHLADIPYTREFTIVKLCRLLVHENFEMGAYYNIQNLTAEQQLVKDCMVAWGDAGGNIRAVLSTIFQSPLFRSQSTARHKIKSPFEYTVSAVRALRADLGSNTYAAGTDGYDLATPMDRMGMELFARSAPNGWPEAGNQWLDTGTVGERLRFIQNLMVEPSDPLKVQNNESSGQNVCNPAALLINKLSAADQQDPEAIMAYLVNLLFPGEGSANLDLDVELGVELLNTNAAGAADPLSNHSPGTPEYDLRTRSAVGLLLASPKFQEQ